ncbi:MAG: AAA family ATPase [Lachnospiraceae bacterium]|nr:AAA family ATPase [Lachnospiraceae bacterium]
MRLVLEYLFREITRDTANKLINVVPGQRIFEEKRYEIYFEEDDENNQDGRKRAIKRTLLDSYNNEKNTHLVSRFIEGNSNCFSWRFDEDDYTDGDFIEEAPGMGWKWKNFPPLGERRDSDKRVDPRLVIADIIRACRNRSDSPIEGFEISKVVFYDGNQKMELIRGRDWEISSDENLLIDEFSFKEVRLYNNNELLWNVTDAVVFFPYRYVAYKRAAFEKAFPAVSRGKFKHQIDTYDLLASDGGSLSLEESYQWNLTPCTMGMTASGTVAFYGNIKHEKDEIFQGYPHKMLRSYTGLFLWELPETIGIRGDYDDVDQQVLVNNAGLLPLLAEKNLIYDYDESECVCRYMCSLGFVEAFQNRLFKNCPYKISLENGSLGFEEDTLFWTFRYILSGEITTCVKYNAGRREAPVLISINKSEKEYISYNCSLTSLINQTDGLAIDVLNLTEAWEDNDNVPEDWKRADSSEELNLLLVQLVKGSTGYVSSDSGEIDYAGADFEPYTEEGDARLNVLKNRLYGKFAEDSRVIDVLSAKLARWLPLLMKANVRGISMREYLKESRNRNLPPIANFAIMGEPGTGKTTLARRLAENCFGAYFKEILSGGLVSYYIGGTENLIAKIILQMKEKTDGWKYPSVLFLDEAYILFESKKEGAKGTGDAIDLIVNLASEPENRKPIDLSKLGQKDRTELGLEDGENEVSIPDNFSLWIGGYKDRLSISFQSNSGLNRRFTKLTMPSPKPQHLWNTIAEDIGNAAAQDECLKNSISQEQVMELLNECKGDIEDFIRWATSPALSGIFGNYAGAKQFAQNCINRLILVGTGSKERQKEAILRSIQEQRMDIKERYKYSVLKEIDNPPFEAVTDIVETFDNYAGNKALKDELCDIIDMMVDETNYRKRGIDLPKGALLMGPPGTGKTFIARCMAGELQKRLKDRKSEKTTAFFPVSAAELLNTGNPVKVISVLFSSAEEYDYVIIFIDEIDAIGKRRELQNNIGPLIQLMKEMDGFTERNNLFVLAATNSPESLDPALKREGRFDLRLEVGTPDKETSEALFAMYLKKYNVNYNEFSPEQKDKLIRMLAGYTPAQVKADLNEAILLYYRIQKWLLSRSENEGRIDFAHRIFKDEKAVNDGKTVYCGENIKPQETVDVDLFLMDLKETLDVRRLGNRNAIVEKEREITTTDEFVKAWNIETVNTAVHEMGHALVKLLKNQFDIERITILGRGDMLGYVETNRDPDKSTLSKRYLLDMIMVSMGGRAAEELIFGEENASIGAVEDIRKATYFARQMVTLYGFCDDVGFMALGEMHVNYLETGYVQTCSESFRSKADEGIAAILSDCYDKTKKLLEEKRELLIKMAFEVYQKMEMSGNELQEMFRKYSDSR